MAMDITQLSKKLTISVSTLYKWTSEKKIPHAKIGRRVAFDEGDIEKWFEEKKVKTRALLDLTGLRYLYYTKNT